MLSRAQKWVLVLAVVAALVGVANAARPVDVARLVALLNGSPTFLGTLTATAGTPKDNTNTAVTFTINAGSCLHIRCTAAAYWMPVASASLVDLQSELAQANVTTKDFCLTNNQTTISMDPVAGTTSCFVFLDN